MITDKDKVTTLMNTLTKTIEVYKKNQNLVKMLGKYATPENAEAIKTLLESLNDPDVQNALKILADPTVQKLFNKLPGIMEGFEAVSPLLNEMQADLAKPEVKAELDNLPETMKTLSEISDTLNANSKEINAIVALLSDDGTDMVNTLLESIDLMISRVSAINTAVSSATAMCSWLSFRNGSITVRITASSPRAPRA